MALIKASWLYDQRKTERLVAVKLRLMRMGKKKQPSYRVVAADSRKARNGRFIEIVGTYNPRVEPSHIEINNERALHWLRHGAQPSERVQKLLVISGAWTEFTGDPIDAPVQPEAPAKVTMAASAAEAHDEAHDEVQQAKASDAAEPTTEEPEANNEPEDALEPPQTASSDEGQLEDKES